MQQPNLYYQNLQAFLKRGFMLDIISPPSEPAFRHSRDFLVEPVKKRFPFPVMIGFIGMESIMSTQRELARINSEHRACVVHVIEQNNNPVIKLEPPNIDELIDSYPKNLMSFAEYEQKEKYHRQNKIEKRRRKR